MNRKPLSDEEIVPAIRRQFCRKLEIGSLKNTHYYADPNGFIYSLNNPAEPKCISAKEGSGLMQVALYTSDGPIMRFMVGDLIAETFLNTTDRDESETTVTYRDGDMRNNAVDNLVWATKHDQSKQLRIAQVQRLQGRDGPDRNGASIETPILVPLSAPIPKATTNGTHAPEADVPIPMVPEKDPLIKQIHSLQARLQESQAREARLKGALRPFAEFQMSPKHAVDVGSAKVIESNRGTDIHSVLTVHDFRAAKSTYEER